MLLSRRFVILCSALLPMVSARAAEEHPAVALIQALYAEHLKSIDGDGKPIQANQPIWPRFFTPALELLWKKVEARTPRGEQGPISFDPFTSSQDPEVKDLKLSLEAVDAGAATVLARFQQFGAETRVAYTVLKTSKGWRIDDVVNRIDGKRWSLRRALSGRKQ